MATTPRYGHVVGQYQSAAKLRVDNCFSEFYYPNGQPTPLLAKAQANLGIQTGATFPLLGPNGTSAAPTYAFANAPTAGLFLDPRIGNLLVLDGGNSPFMAINGGGGGLLASTSVFVWSATADYAGGTWDLGFARNAAGVMEINNGTKGTFADLRLRAARHSGVTVATLPTGVPVGTVACVTDGTAALAWGATVTGGGSTPYLIWYNGTAWKVIGE